MIVNISQFRFFKCEKSVIKHKVTYLINKLIDLQGFLSEIALERLKKAIYLYSILKLTTYETNCRKWFYENRMGAG